LFKILLHEGNGKTPLAETQFSDHASRIARTLAELYGHRVDVFEYLPECEPRLVEYYEMRDVTERKMTRVPLDPRTGQPYT